MAGPWEEFQQRQKAPPAGPWDNYAPQVPIAAEHDYGPSPPPKLKPWEAYGKFLREDMDKRFPKGPIEKRSQAGFREGFGQGPLLSDETWKKYPILGYPAAGAMGGLRGLNAILMGGIGAFAGAAENLSPDRMVRGENTERSQKIGDTIQGGLSELASGINPAHHPIPTAAGVYAVGRNIPAARRAGQTVEKIFSPDTVDPAAREAAGSIRQATGEAARRTAQTEQAMEPFWKTVNQMDPVSQRAFIDYIENRSTQLAPTQGGLPRPGGGAAFDVEHMDIFTPQRGGTGGPNTLNAPPQFAGRFLHDPVMQELADRMREAFRTRMEKLQSLPSTQQAAFIEDYFPHFWKNPRAAAQMAENYARGPSKAGSGASLRKRTIPTVQDGIEAGLEPITTNPIEATLRYVASMDRFIASTEVLDIAKTNGTVRWIKPKVVGASGHPDSFQGVPEGYVKLEGRATSRPDGAQAYAPEGFARVFNNYHSRGIGEFGPEYQRAYDTLRHGSNAVTALELGLSGYHMLTMMQEGVVNEVAGALGMARNRHFGEAAKRLAQAPAAPVTLAMKGRKARDIYLGLTEGTAENRELVDLLTKAGGRARGARHAPDYDFSSQGSYMTALKRGALKGQMLADKNEALSGVGGTAKVAFRHMGRIIDTVAQPIFEKYIPIVKNGAFMENMGTWMKQNPHASESAKLHAARQIWDSIDNRFGEMVNDNVFWHNSMKQAAQLSLRSWSWTMGTQRELGGAVRDFTRVLDRRQPPNQLPAVIGQRQPFHEIGPNDKRWTQKMDYAIALPLTYAALGATYQYLKTGEGPKDVQDLLGPRTGGTDPATGQPERVILPGYMKDVFGFSEHPVDEATNKIATAPTAVKQLLTNQNWRGDPIFPPSGGEGEDAPSWMRAFWNYATDSFGPITVRDMMKGPKRDTGLNTFEKALGVRTAPRYITDPDGFTQMMDRVQMRKWRTKQRYEQRQEGFYENE